MADNIVEAERCARVTRQLVPALKVCDVCAGPLHVSVGDESPGYMPWSGHGESWIGWCYPYPRPVQASLAVVVCESMTGPFVTSCYAHAAGKFALKSVRQCRTVTQQVLIFCRHKYDLAFVPCYAMSCVARNKCQIIITNTKVQNPALWEQCRRWYVSTGLPRC